MPTPTTTHQLLTNLRKSGLVPPAKLDAMIADQASDGSPRGLLERLVEADLLTPFQADRMAAGKYKGFILGSYTILDRLGGGGMGQVFLAEHTVMHRLVALKVLTHGNGSDTVARERFLREARAAASLRHPNIIGVHDLRTDGPVYYLVMEYVEGITLQQLVAKGGPVPFRVAAHYAWQVAQGLQHAHEAQLVHRDVKPANLLLGRDGTVRVLDLGLVRSVAGSDSKLTSRLDRAILGTADYLAPEQAVNSSDVDTRADIYSLGATLYFMLGGRTLFPEGRTAQKLMWQQLRDPMWIQELSPEVPDGLAQIVHRALKKDPNQRFQTPGEFANALAEFAAETTPVPSAELMPDPPRWKNRRSSSSRADLGDSSCGAASTGTARAELTAHANGSTPRQPAEVALAETPKPRGTTPIRMHPFGGSSLLPMITHRKLMQEKEAPQKSKLTIDSTTEFPVLPMKSTQEPPRTPGRSTCTLPSRKDVSGSATRARIRKWISRIIILAAIAALGWLYFQ